MDIKKEAFDLSVNIIFSDYSGGVKTVSRSLFLSLKRMQVGARLEDISNFGNSFITKFYRSLTYLMRFNKSDIFILQHFFPIFLGIFLRLFGYKKLVNVVHIDLVAYYQSISFLKKVVITLMFRFLRKSVIVFVSKESEVKARTKFNLKNSSVIYNVYNFTCEESDPVDNKNELKLGSISRLHRVKNIDLLIRVLKSVVKKEPNVKLLIYGGGDQEYQLSKYIKSQGCDEFVKLVGISNDKNKMYSSIDALVSLSSNEGLPTTILESINYGVPVLYTDCSSGPRELMSPSSEPLTKTRSFEKTNVGYLVKPTSKTATYSDNLDCEESEYVDIMQSFIDDVKNNQFSMKYDTERFSDEVIAQEWIALISRFP